MGLEGGADAVWTGGRVEAELREQRPDGAPVAGEDAGPRGGGGVAELEKDVDNVDFGKRAEEVLAAAVAVGGLGGAAICSSLCSMVDSRVDFLVHVHTGTCLGMGMVAVDSYTDIQRAKTGRAGLSCGPAKIVPSAIGSEISVGYFCTLFLCSIN
jgi:hypothetical protein